MRVKKWRVGNRTGLRITDCDATMCRYESCHDAVSHYDAESHRDTEICRHVLLRGESRVEKRVAGRVEGR